MERINIPGLSPYYGLATGFSRSFQNLIKDMGDARSKCEEDRIIQREIKYLKENIDKPNVESKSMKENLVRLMYCEMLGHDASFGFIHAVNFTQKAKLMEKRIGYLACCLLLREDHELTLLLMNALQKDLKSTNVMENCIALMAASRLVNKETIPTVLPSVTKLLQHKREMVRKKAVMVLLRFYQLDPTSLSGIKSKFEVTLCDRNPGVMGTTLNVYLKLIAEDPEEYKRFTGPFVNILKQVIEGRLPNDMNYYNVPAPWIQIKLFKILAMLGQDDQKQSEAMYEILKQCIDTAHVENNIGCAVLSECLYTVAMIHPLKSLSEMAARRVGLFLVSNNNNLKYLGIKILAHLIKSDVSYAFRHQMTVIDCLNDPDETLKRKTLVLLYRITNSSNVSVICEKLINYLRSSVDDHLRSDLVDKITTLAEKEKKSSPNFLKNWLSNDCGWVRRREEREETPRYAPDNEWFIETMNEVFELGGNLVSPQVSHNIMRLIGEGTDDDELDTELRLHAVNSYLDLMEKPSLPDMLLHLICWVIGEYSYLVDHCEPEVVMDKLCRLLDRKFNDKSTKPWIVTAITKIAGRLGYLPDDVQESIEKQLRISTDVEVKQRCSDLLGVFKVFDSFDEILPVDASCEDLEVDSTLSFLDGFVSKALANGAVPYRPKHLREAGEHKKPNSEANKIQSSLNYSPYPKQEEPKRVTENVFQTNSHSDHLVRNTAAPISTIGVSLPGDSEHRYETKPRKTAKNVWGPTGYMGDRTEEKSRSDSSSSGSLSSGVADDVIKPKYKEVRAPSLTEYYTEETERMKLAQQLFTTPSSQDETLRSDKAGLHSRKRHEKQSRTQLSLASDDCKVNQNFDQKNTTKQNPDRLEIVKGLANDNRTLLLDLDDSAVDENSLSEPPEVTSPMVEYNNSNLSLLGDLDLKHDVTVSNAVVTEAGNDQLNADSLQETVVLSQTLNAAFDDSKNTINLLDEDNDDLITTSDSSLNMLEQKSIPTIPPHLERYPKSASLVICEDANIKLSCHKILSPESLALVLHTINQRSTNLADVYWTFRPPLNLTSLLDDSTELSATVERIDSWQHETHVLSMKFKSPSRRMLLDGQLSYRDSTGTQKRLFINLDLSVFDFIRPLNITTEVYGGKWGTQTYEKRQQISTAKSLENVLSLIESEVNFAVVQVIGNEAIMAATILGKEECLLHFKYPSREFRLRTGSELLNECIISDLNKLLN